MTRKSRRTARVLHLKSQNVIGASIVKNYMDNTVAFKYGFAGEDPDTTASVEKESSSNVYSWAVLRKLLFLFSQQSCLEFVGTVL